jgi:hypothetical protein
MKLPFTIQQFFDVFASYNGTVFPAQIFFYLLALLALWFIIRGARYANIYTSAALAFLWLWMGIVYHLLFFSEINKAAYVFGPLFILQGLLFFYYGVVKHQLQYTFHTDLYTITGGLLIFYALILYPLLGYMAGHVYPSSPTFGLPCPTTIFTLGLLLWTGTKLPKLLLIIPLLWSVIGFSAAFTLGVAEDTGLIVAGLATLVLVVVHRRRTTGKHSLA